MAAKPIERFVKRQIADQGGWARILERIGSGETIADVSRTLFRPDGKAIDRSTLSHMLHRDPDRSLQVKQAQVEGADAMVDEAIHQVDEAVPERDDIQRRRVKAEMRLKVAGLLNREQWGEAKAGVSVTINSASLHVDALRHRMVDASRPLADLLAQPDGLSAPPGAQVKGAELASLGLLAESEDVV